MLNNPREIGRQLGKQMLALKKAQPPLSNVVPIQPPKAVVVAPSPPPIVNAPKAPDNPVSVVVNVPEHPAPVVQVTPQPAINVAASPPAINVAASPPAINVAASPPVINVQAAAPTFEVVAAPPAINVAPAVNVVCDMEPVARALEMLASVLAANQQLVAEGFANLAAAMNAQAEAALAPRNLLIKDGKPVGLVVG